MISVPSPAAPFSWFWISAMLPLLSNPATVCVVPLSWNFAFFEPPANVRIVPVYTDTNGYITADLITRETPDLSSAIAYAAGPDPFVRAMRQALLEAGVDPDDIRTEEFPGY